MKSYLIMMVLLAFMLCCIGMFFYGLCEGRQQVIDELSAGREIATQWGVIGRVE